MNQKIKINSDTAMNTPSEILFDNNGVYVSKTLIPQTHEYSEIVYFVSGANGDEFGQFNNAADAIKKAEKMAEYSEKERKAFDE